VTKRSFSSRNDSKAEAFHVRLGILQVDSGRFLLLLWNLPRMFARRQPFLFTLLDGNSAVGSLLMSSRFQLIGWVVLAVICTAVIFLFPAQAGPYSVVRGPATALRAWDFAVGTLAGIALAASVISARLMFNESLPLPGESGLDSATSQFASSCILRC
jgi:hypothetical protein